MKSIQITIEGTTPLICNRFTDEAQMGAESGTRPAITSGKGSPLEQAQKKLYYSTDGDTLIIPQPNMFRCIIDSGAYFKVGKSKITTQKSSLIPAGLEIEGTEIPIISQEPWRVDTRAVRIPSTGGRIPCHRPMFDSWSLSFVINIDTDMFEPKLVRELIDCAGKRIGLGDFRPSCKGPFGKFVVKSWNELN